MNESLKIYIHHLLICQVLFIRLETSCEPKRVRCFVCGLYALTYAQTSARDIPERSISERKQLADYLQYLRNKVHYITCSHNSFLFHGHGGWEYGIWPRCVPSLPTSEPSNQTTTLKHGQRAWPLPKTCHSQMSKHGKVTKEKATKRRKVEEDKRCQTLGKMGLDFRL